MLFNPVSFAYMLRMFPSALRKKSQLQEAFLMVTDLCIMSAFPAFAEITLEDLDVGHWSPVCS